jgi:NAD(P)-dependent dehydrogenase (short-subunit alcohol dehydrogenase family)
VTGQEFRAGPVVATAKVMGPTLAIMAAAFFASFTPLPVAAQSLDAPTVLITGSSRGIGFEFARQYAAKGWNVIATCRTPQTATALNALAAAHDNVTIEQLDVTDHARIDALAAQYMDMPIDVLLNNAGINPGRSKQTFGALDYAIYRQIMEVNAVGPLKMAEAFTDHVAASDQKKIIAVSSGTGSFEVAKRLPGFLAPYRSSKAALNMSMHIVAKSVKGKGIMVAILNPGIVDTDQAKGVNAPKMKPDKAIGGMIGVIETLTMEQSGLFIAWNGQVTPW